MNGLKERLLEKINKKKHHKKLAKAHDATASELVPARHPETSATNPFKRHFEQTKGPIKQEASFGSGCPAKMIDGSQGAQIKPKSSNTSKNKKSPGPVLEVPHQSLKAVEVISPRPKHAVTGKRPWNVDLDIANTDAIVLSVSNDSPPRANKQNGDRPKPHKHDKDRPSHEHDDQPRHTSTEQNEPRPHKKQKTGAYPLGPPLRAAADAEPGPETPYPYEVDDADHAETPAEAYRVPA
jgi:hypothetical protein